MENKTRRGAGLFPRLVAVAGAQKPPPKMFADME
jgi:hypothetical protein